MLDEAAPLEHGDVGRAVVPHVHAHHVAPGGPALAGPAPPRSRASSSSSSRRAVADIRRPDIGVARRRRSSPSVDAPPLPPSAATAGPPTAAAPLAGGRSVRRSAGGSAVADLRLRCDGGSPAVADRRARRRRGRPPPWRRRRRRRSSGPGRRRRRCSPRPAASASPSASPVAVGRPGVGCGLGCGGCGRRAPAAPTAWAAAAVAGGASSALRWRVLGAGLSSVGAAGSFGRAQGSCRVSEAGRPPWVCSSDIGIPSLMTRAPPARARAVGFERLQPRAAALDPLVGAQRPGSTSRRRGRRASRQARVGHAVGWTVRARGRAGVVVVVRDGHWCAR